MEDVVKGRPPEDLGALLGLAGPAARAILVLYWIAIASMAVLSGDETIGNPATIAALLITLGSAALIVSPSPDPLPVLPTTVVMVGAIVTSTVLVWQLNPTDPPSYSSWNFGADSFLMFGLALRGRIGSAWIGMGGVVATTLLWSFVRTGDVLPGVIYAYQHPILLLAGSFFALGLRRTAGRTRDFRAIERLRVADEHALAVGEAWRSEALLRIHAMVGPSLDVIAAGSPTPAEREEHRLLEASLRDLLRARRLAAEPLQSAVRTLRAAGREVVLLDDVDDPSDSAIDGVALHDAVVWAAEQVSASSTDPSDTLTIRLAEHEGGPALTVAGGQTSEPARRDLLG
jgi:hypothetical protein